MRLKKAKYSKLYVQKCVTNKEYLQIRIADFQQELLLVFLLYANDLCFVFVNLEMVFDRLAL